MTEPSFSIRPARWIDDLGELRRIREQVFIVEQNVPAEDEWDDIDAASSHVIAHDGNGFAIGTGRLTPQHTIGRVAVLMPWRGSGVGAALVRTLLEQARERGIGRVELHSQTQAIAFYKRLGFSAFGEQYLECGIPHQTMRIDLPASTVVPRIDPTVATDDLLRVRNREELIDAHRRLFAAAKTDIAILSHDLDPGVLDAPDVLAQLRRVALSGRRARIRILVRLPSMRAAGLIALAQRLPTAIAVRSPVTAEDSALSLGLVLNDASGYLLRNDADRVDGHGSLTAAARQRPLQRQFDELWERAEPCAEVRALSI